MKSIFSTTVLTLCFLYIGICNANDIPTLLKDGRAAIESGKYEAAVNCLGKILELSENQSNDPKVMALGGTVQAYALIKLNDPQLVPMARQYLEKAITDDPDWVYPKKMLEEMR